MDDISEGGSAGVTASVSSKKASASASYGEADSKKNTDGQTNADDQSLGLNIANLNRIIEFKNVNEISCVFANNLFHDVFRLLFRHF